MVGLTTEKKVFLFFDTSILNLAFSSSKKKENISNYIFNIKDLLVVWVTHVYDYFVLQKNFIWLAC